MSAAPVLDPRDAAAVAAELAADAPAYLPPGAVPTGRAAGAVMQAYARYRGLLNQGLNRLPERHQAAFFDMLGERLLPAQGARVPLVFAVAPESTLDITLAEGSQVAATQSAPLPSLEPGAPPPAPAQTPVFATERTVTLTPGRLVSLSSLDAGSDLYADHSDRQTQGFEPFTAMQPTPHELYLGHDTLFALGGHDITLIIGLQLQQASREPLALAWEYFTEAGWLPLPHALEEDTTGGLTGSGQVTLRRVCGPNAKKHDIGERESFWIRARLLTPLQQGMAVQMPVVNDIRVRVKFRKAGLLPEAGFADVSSLDFSKNFFPFGQRPEPHACFYLASREVFSRAGARVHVNFAVGTLGSGSPSPELAWEYLAAQGWSTLLPTPPDDPNAAKSFPFDAVSTEAVPRSVAFFCPDDWTEAEVNGVRNHWLRIRLTAGNFGIPAVYNPAATPPFTPASFNPPSLVSLKLDFEYLTEPEPVQYGFAHNDFRYTDVTEAALWPDKTFKPFTPVEDQASAIHFGFDRPLPDGLGSFFVHCPTAAASAGEASPWQWEYRSADGWRELAVIDETAGFQRSGMVQFIGPRDAVAAQGLHGRLFRIRARLKRGEALVSVSVAGLWLNAVWATHRREVERELVGRSDGNPGQRLSLGQVPVLEGERVEVEEWVGRGDAWRLALTDLAEADLRLERDRMTGEVLIAWVRWSARPHLHDAVAGDRVYTLERATGALRFGPHVPLAGRRVLVSYRSGGGLGGNVAAGSVTQLRLAQPLITAVTNPVAAAAGADAETLPRALQRGPQGLRHRQRAVSVQDIEWLAREASPEVARVRCLPLRGPDGLAQRGHFTVLVAPYGTEARPVPTEGLARDVRDFLARHAPATARIRVLGPGYASVSARAVIVPRLASDAALVEARVRHTIDRFLHPLMGGTDGEGWQFGQSVPLSRLATVLAAVRGVSHVKGLVLVVDGALCRDFATLGADLLPCPGPHELVLKVEGSTP